MDIFSSLAEQLINGLRTGSIYALIALGYTMVYGIAKMINFAHGDIIMVGAYLLFLLGVGKLGLPTPVVILLAIILCAVLGMLIEKIAYKPLRNAPPLAVLITAIGVSYFLQNFVLISMGATPIPFASMIKVPSLTLGTITVSGITLATLVVTFVCMAGLIFFVQRTKTGAAMRAVSEDRGAAELMGINVNKTISLTFAIGSGLAAVAGLLFISQYESLQPTLGALPGIKAFVAAVLGGIGSIPGAIAGGIILGIIESLTKAYISTQLSDAISFSVLVLVLLIRPAGIMGKMKNEKV
ncbi:branched-chain amino acid ABC transporter permease [Scatolibacter rhodanostii]|uniref:branched-chain amino acid ABC transporter permease n=1 Tax=Scatolibacter rhodanostii TaxID=2014781 RepID=UPI000C076D6D|nr:branched-chain amino acid ABC transporter permease [Scatolibacter rhodanostii]